MTDSQPVSEESERSATIWSALSAWGESLRPWQRFALCTAVSEISVSPDKLEECYKLFLKEHHLLDADADTIDPNLQVVDRPIGAPAAPIVLVKVTDLAGVNALPPDATLEFGRALTVIYGSNGSGKSGFSRLLANACFSRSKPEILPNIYSDDKNAGATATFYVDTGDTQPVKIVYPAETSGSVLKRLSVFDSAVARHHLTQASPFEFRPAGFDVFPELVRVNGALAEKLEKDIQARCTEADFAEAFLGGGTPVHAAIANLSADTDLEQLRELAEYGAAESARITALDDQILALRTNSKIAVIESLREAREDVEAIATRLSALGNVFGVESARARQTSILEASALTKAAEALGSDQFKRPYFKAVGTREWNKFVTAARDLARAECEAYPTTEHRCLLCEQALNEQSAEHIRALLDFVEGDARSMADTATSKLVDEANTIRDLDINIFAPASRVRTHIGRIDPDTAKCIELAVADLNVAKAAACSDLLSLAVTASPVELDGLVAKLRDLQDRIALDLRTLEVSDTEAAITVLADERRTLRHRHVLSQQLKKIEQHVANAVWVRCATRAKTNLGTRSITEKEKELFGRIVGVTYKERFAGECEALDCRVPVELQTMGRSGETHRALAMKGGYKPEAILSEGEQKSVALADFLTEALLNPAAAGIIFDDPVTSLDHQRKAKIARRLVMEAQRRQVIIFTHDLVFLNQLLIDAEDLDCAVAGHWIARTSDGRPGQVALGDTPVTTRSYENTSRAKEARSHAETLQGTAREDALRKGMGALRTTLEETVVRKVFKDIVPRWTDQVRVTALRRVNWDNVKVGEICSLYEDLSRLIEGHSHTDEAAGAPIDLQDLDIRIAQVDALIRWARADRPRQAS